MRGDFWKLGLPNTVKMDDLFRAAFANSFNRRAVSDVDPGTSQKNFQGSDRQIETADCLESRGLKKMDDHRRMASA